MAEYQEVRMVVERTMSHPLEEAQRRVEEDSATKIVAAFHGCVQPAHPTTTMMMVLPIGGWVRVGSCPAAGTVHVLGGANPADAGPS
eukprot:2961974-Rhodomonas_salina.1